MADASILITVFNCERYIEQSVASALAQTAADFEVIVVDDGSTDLTPAKLRGLEDPRLRTVNCCRVGRGKALNIGLRECSSPHVAILDADDIALPDRLRRQLHFLNFNPDIAIVGSRYRTFIDAAGKPTGKEDIAPNTFQEIVEQFKRYHGYKGYRFPMFHSSVMYRKRAILDVGGYDETLPCHVDSDLFVRVASRYAIANMNERLSLKRRHPQQFFFGDAGVFRTPEAQEVRQNIAARALNLTIAPALLAAGNAVVE